jgi:hypothetical protein
MERRRLRSSTAPLMAQDIPVHQVDDGTQSSNVIDGPFKRHDVDRDDDVT